MDQVLNPFLLKLDKARSLLLQKTLCYSWGRNLFTDRPMRLLVLFAIAFGFYLPMTLLFPIWIAVIGPVIWGLPHILASLRYTKIVESKNSLHFKSFFIFLWTAITFFRIGTDLNLLQIPEFFMFDVEIVGLALSVLAFSLLSMSSKQWSMKSLNSGVLLTALVAICAWKAPIEFAAVILMLHNFIAYFYWISQSTTKKDRTVAILALMITSITTALIVMGFFDGLYKWITPIGYISIAGLDYSDLGKSLAPWSENYQDWFRFFVAYAFTQALHYFVWMKAIPEQHLKQQMPISFRASYHWLLKDFGQKLGKFLFLFCVAALGIWVFFELKEARLIYFAIASYHGFHEIAGLSFLEWREDT